MRIAVTGAGGFIGRALLPRLAEAGHEPVLLLRKGPDEELAAFGRVHEVGPLEKARGLEEALSGASTVLHLAGRVHVMGRETAEERAFFRAANRDATMNLARAALATGVRRFVFLSTAKVFGETSPGRPFRPDDEPDPSGAYAISKWQAEENLRTLLATTQSLELVVLRPPLVYGAGALGNLKRLLEAVATGRPLPFARVANRRSLIARESLAEALRLAAERPGLAGRVLLPAESPPLSTAEMALALAEGIGRPPRLLAAPGLGVALRLLGRRALAERLFGDFEVESESCWRQLGWRPEASPYEGLVEVGRSYARLPW